MKRKKYRTEGNVASKVASRVDFRVSQMYSGNSLLKVNLSKLSRFFKLVACICHCHVFLSCFIPTFNFSPPLHCDCLSLCSRTSPAEAKFEIDSS